MMDDHCNRVPGSSKLISRGERIGEDSCVLQMLLWFLSVCSATNVAKFTTASVSLCGDVQGGFCIVFIFLLPQAGDPNKLHDEVGSSCSDGLLLSSHTCKKLLIRV